MEYLKNFNNYVTGWLQKQNKKKLIENCVIIIIIGIIAIIAGGSFFSKDTQTKAAAVRNEDDMQAAAKMISSEEKEDINKKMESILSKIEGAGNVNVLITYVSGKEIVPAYDSKRSDNDTQEKDSGGGTRSIKQSDIENKIVYEETQGGEKKAIVLKELQPAVKGVVVVADGATDPVVKESLVRAVQVLVDVPVHKIQVFPRNK